MENENTIRCIICLEEEKDTVINSKLFHVPCTCHYHIHPNCFRQYNSNKCLTCKREYGDDQLLNFNRLIEYRRPYEKYYQIGYLLLYFFGYIIIFGISSILVIVLLYGIGYVFNCMNQLIDKSGCDKVLFEQVNLLIELFIFGLIMAFRADMPKRNNSQRRHDRYMNNITREQHAHI